MEIETTPWHETRIVISPQFQMIAPDKMVQYRTSFLKDESPRTATPQKRFVQYDANYVKYFFLKDFYQLLFDGVRSEGVEAQENLLTALLAETVAEFAQYCREHPLEENAHPLFQAFCKARLF